MLGLLPCTRRYLILMWPFMICEEMLCPHAFLSALVGCQAVAVPDTGMTRQTEGGPPGMQMLGLLSCAGGHMQKKGPKYLRVCEL